MPFQIRLSCLLLVALFASCNTTQSSLHVDELFAWCIVPFDKEERSPEERIEMLRELGISAYAYDWRTEHLPSMQKEFRLAREAKIEIIGVWMWIDARHDAIDTLSASNLRVIEAIRQMDAPTTLWVGFHDNFFDTVHSSAWEAKGARMISYIADLAAQSDTPVMLYNHGGWLGDPRNQVSIIKRLPQHHLGIVYNFHHGHDHLDDFEQIVPSMIPHLRFVNLNGVSKEGPKIMSPGTGQYEAWMLRVLLDHGYDGPFGILGHLSDRDVKKVLQENLDNLSQLSRKLSTQ